MIVSLLVRRRHGRNPRDRRRCDVRADRVQRPFWGFAHRLGALPRLPDRDSRSPPSTCHTTPPRRCSPTVNKPWDVVAAAAVCRHRRLPAAPDPAAVPLPPWWFALVDLATQLLLVILGLALLFSPHALNQGNVTRYQSELAAIAFALPLAMLAYTRARDPVATSPRRCAAPAAICAEVFSAIGLVVVLYAATRRRWALCLPASPPLKLGSTWAKAPDDVHRRPPEGSLAERDRSSAAGLRGPVGSPDPADGGAAYVGLLASAACPTRSASTDSCRASSGASAAVDHRAAARSSPRRRSRSLWSWRTTALSIRSSSSQGCYRFGVLLAFTRPRSPWSNFGSAIRRSAAPTGAVNIGRVPVPSVVGAFSDRRRLGPGARDARGPPDRRAGVAACGTGHVRDRAPLPW